MNGLDIYAKIHRHYVKWLAEHEPQKQRIEAFGRILAYAQKHKTTIKEAADILGERLRINEMCITCSNHISGACGGTVNPVYSGCICKNKDLPDRDYRDIQI